MTENTAIWLLMLGMIVFVMFPGVLMFLIGLVVLYHKTKWFQIELVIGLIGLLMSLYASYKMTKETIALFGNPFYL